MAKERKEVYVDDHYLNQIQILPEGLRPKQGGMSKEDLKIYDDFNNN